MKKRKGRKQKAAEEFRQLRADARRFKSQGLDKNRRRQIISLKALEAYGKKEKLPFRAISRLLGLVEKREVEFRDAIDVIDDLIVLFHRRPVKPLLIALKNPVPMNQIMAASRLALIKAPQGLPVLKKILLEERNPDIARMAGEELVSTIDKVQKNNKTRAKLVFARANMADLTLAKQAVLLYAIATNPQVRRNTPVSVSDRDKWAYLQTIKRELKERPLDEIVKVLRVKEKKS